MAEHKCFFAAKFGNFAKKKKPNFATLTKVVRFWFFPVFIDFYWEFRTRFLPEAKFLSKFCHFQISGQQILFLEIQKLSGTSHTRT